MDESSSDINSFIIDKDPTQEDIDAAKLIGFNALKKHQKTIKTIQTSSKSKRNNILDRLEASPISGLDEMSSETDISGDEHDSSNSEQDVFPDRGLIKSNKKIKPFASNCTPFFEKNNSKSRTLYWTHRGKMTHSILQMEENIRIDFSDVDFSAPVSLTVSQQIVQGCFSELGFIIIYKQKEKHSVAFRAFSGDKKLTVIRTGFEHSTILNANMSKDLILVTTASKLIRGKHTLFLFNIYGREIASFISPSSVLSVALSPLYITVISSSSSLNNRSSGNNYNIDRYKIEDNKYVLKEHSTSLPLFIKAPSFIAFDEFNNLYISDNNGNLIMHHNFTHCLQFIFNFKVYFKDELSEYYYFPIYIKNKMLFYIKQQKSKGKYVEPFAVSNLNLVELSTVNFNKHGKHKKVNANNDNKTDKGNRDDEEERSTLFGSGDVKGMTKLEILENEFSNLNLFGNYKVKEGKQIEEDKLAIRIISELIRVKKNEGLIMDYVRLLNRKVSVLGAVKLCRNYNMFRLSEQIEEMMEKKFISELEVEKKVEKKKEHIKDNNENKSENESGEKNTYKEENVKKIEEEKGEKDDEEEKEVVKKTKEVFVNPFKFK